MPIRRTLETAVAQDPDGVWRQRDVLVVARSRVRVVSDRAHARAHQRGQGEDFEVLVDKDLQVWVRKFGSDTAIRKDEDVRGVSLVVVEDVSAGISHDLSYQARPQDDLVQWACACGEHGRAWIARDVAIRQSTGHAEASVARDVAAADRAAAARRRALEDP